jgi:hypothetical protein
LVDAAMNNVNEATMVRLMIMVMRLLRVVGMVGDNGLLPITEPLR